VGLVEDSPEIAAALESLSVLTAGDPDEEMRRREISRLVQVTLDRLPERYGSALRWKYIEGVSVREIGTRLEVSAKAAESVLTRAREAFRDGFSTLSRGSIPARQEMR
jgi:RNA polymerase sigma factor (sigma-70 family)